MLEPLARDPTSDLPSSISSAQLRQLAHSIRAPQMRRCAVDARQAAQESEVGGADPWLAAVRQPQNPYVLQRLSPVRLADLITTQPQALSGLEASHADRGALVDLATATAISDFEAAPQRPAVVNALAWLCPWEGAEAGDGRDSELEDEVNMRAGQ